MIVSMASWPTFIFHLSIYLSIIVSRTASRPTDQLSYFHIHLSIRLSFLRPARLSYIFHLSVHIPLLPALSVTLENKRLDCRESLGQNVRLDKEQCKAAITKKLFRVFNLLYKSYGESCYG
jgi:hypothetical protein